MRFAPMFGHVVRKDALGDGAFGASRDGGSREHLGMDLRVIPGQLLFAPFSCSVVRVVEACYPARNMGLKGIVLRPDAFPEVEVKILYVRPRVKVGAKLVEGDVVSVVQDVSLRYTKEMQPHIHLEMTHGSVFIDPLLHLERLNG